MFFGKDVPDRRLSDGHHSSGDFFEHADRMNPRQNARPAEAIRTGILSDCRSDGEDTDQRFFSAKQTVSENAMPHLKWIRTACPAPAGIALHTSKETIRPILAERHAAGPSIFVIRVPIATKGRWVCTTGATRNAPPG